MVRCDVSQHRDYSVLNHFQFVIINLDFDIELRAVVNAIIILIQIPLWRDMQSALNFIIIFSAYLFFDFDNPAL